MRPSLLLQIQKTVKKIERHSKHLHWKYGNLPIFGPKMPQASGVNSGSFGWKRPSHDLAPDPVGHWVAKNGSKLGSPVLDQYESIWSTNNCWYWHILTGFPRPLSFDPHHAEPSWTPVVHILDLSASSAHVPHLMRPSVKLASVLSFLRYWFVRCAVSSKITAVELREHTPNKTWAHVSLQFLKPRFCHRSRCDFMSVRYFMDHFAYLPWNTEGCIGMFK